MVTDRELDAFSQIFNVPVDELLYGPKDEA